MALRAQACCGDYLLIVAVAQSVSSQTVSAAPHITHAGTALNVLHATRHWMGFLAMGRRGRMAGMDEGGTTTKTGIYCRGCGYDLRESSLRCPECGRTFDTADPRSFYHSSPAHRRRRLLKWVLLLLLVLVLPPALGLGWLAWGWRAEQKHIEAIKPARYQVAEVRPLYPWLPKCLPDRWAFLADRADCLFLPNGRVAMDDLQHVAGLTRLRTMASLRVELMDEGLHALRGLTRLECLMVGGQGITDEGLAHLAGLGRMRTLYMRGTSIAGPGLRHLKAMPGLRDLGLENAPLDNAGLAQLAGMRQLRFLDLSGTQITDAGMTHLAGLTQIREMDLSQTKVGDEGLRHLAGMVDLREFHVRGTAITDAGLEHLRGCRSLWTLYLAGTRVTPAGLQRLQSALPQLRIVGPGRFLSPSATQPALPGDGDR